ncbi:MAG: DUF4365 domain-containing protein [Nitrospirae bacterium]|nr:DUF4365 domain-containing protein [Nitrospirota bacterium]
MKVSGKSAKHTISSFHDREAISRLEVILNTHRLVAPDLKKDDTWPNHDGYLEVLDVNGYLRGTIVAQVKTLDQRKIEKKISYSFNDDKFLSFCSETRENPILLIGVDRHNNIAYWLEMTPQSVKKLKNMTVYFYRENIISEDNSSYHDAWLAICEDRKEKIKDIKGRRREDDLPNKYTHPTKISNKSISLAKQKLQTLFIEINLKYKYYYAFIDLLEPFYLDDKGLEQRKRLRKLFEISEDEEHGFIDKMTNEGLVKIVGSLCFVNELQRARELQKQIIGNEAIDLHLIVNYLS